MLQGIFYFLASVAIAAGLMCVTRKNPLASAIWLVASMSALAGLFLILGSEFLAVIQILVYAGAVMVLFIFVIMLLNLGHTPSDIQRAGVWLPALTLSIVLAVELVALRLYSPERLAFEFTRTAQLTSPAAVFPGGAAAQAASAKSGVLGALAEPMFTQWLLPFELTSVLLLAAIVGAVVIAKRKV